MPDLPSDLIDLEEARKLTGVSTSTIRTWIHAGKLRAWKRGYYNVISRAELETYIARQQEIRPMGASPYEQAKGDRELTASE